MKIGDQSINGFEFIARRDENFCFVRLGAQHTVPRCRFQRARAGGAHRNHPPTASLRVLYRINRRWRQLIPFAVHDVFADIVVAHRLKSTGADVQRYVSEIDALLLHGIQHRLIEMQTGRRRRHRTLVARIHRLVT